MKHCGPDVATIPDAAFTRGKRERSCMAWLLLAASGNPPADLQSLCRRDQDSHCSFLPFTLYPGALKSREEDGGKVPPGSVAPTVKGSSAQIGD